MLKYLNNREHTPDIGEAEEIERFGSRQRHNVTS